MEIILPTPNPSQEGNKTLIEGQIPLLGGVILMQLKFCTLVSKVIAASQPQRGDMCVGK